MDAERRRSAWAEIDLDALKYNIRNIRKQVGLDRRIMAVLKADAYGHGAVRSAELLRSEGVEEFAVATVDEGLDLRKAGIAAPITVLSLCPDAAVDVMLDHCLSPLIGSLEQARKFSDRAAAQDKVMHSFIALDTGMERIGLAADTDKAIKKTVKEIIQIADCSGLKIRGLFTHYATADEADKTFTEKQLGLFNKCVFALAEAGKKFEESCTANSGAIMETPEAWMDIVRPGIILYGEYPSDDVDKSRLDIKPVMSVRARITRLKKIPAGTTVGYGRHFTAADDTLIATIPIGYADGYPRLLSSGGKVLVNGQTAAVAGNICMDQCMIDVTEIPDVKEGDTVTLMGTDGDLSVTASDIASQCNTINYEILCSFGSRLAKIYKNQ
ncbi:MAG: alanine racemase [Eubacteriaceae bacterium]|nr:alanine racemase [Eubacteriaceae bacterium]